MVLAPCRRPRRRLLAVETGMFDQTPADLPSPAARLIANIQATGHGAGHDLHYRVLRELGVTLVGHLLGTEDGRAHFASDLAESVAFGDATLTRREDHQALRAARDRGAGDASPIAL
jgi:putative flavoprotein involved in K+ transport